MPQADKSYREIAAEYRPYDTHPAFHKGAEDYMDGRHDCPFRGVSAQAWDRGHEAAMRYTRQLAGAPLGAQLSSG